jgi:plasmid maintenance system antidote protein VapI
MTDPERTLLSYEELANLAARTDISLLSPLAAPVFQAENSAAPDAGFLENLPLDLLICPTRAYYLSICGSQQQQQSVILNKNALFYYWQDQDDGVSLSKKQNAEYSLAEIYKILYQKLSHEPTYVLILKHKEKEILRELYLYCTALEQTGIVPAFILAEELMEILKEKQATLADLLSLVEKDLVRIVGEKEKASLTQITTKGAEIAKIFGNADELISIMVFTAEVLDFVNITLAATKSGLYLIKEEQVSQSTLVRALDQETLKALIEWAWIADLDLEKTATSSSSQPGISVEPGSISDLNSFKERTKRYHLLKRDHEQGVLSDEAFREAVFTLRFQDSSGTWWQITEDGQGWLMWDGAAWV